MILNIFKKKDTKRESTDVDEGVKITTKTKVLNKTKEHGEKTPIKFTYGEFNKQRKSKAPYKPQSSFLPIPDVLLKPRITEKAAVVSAGNVYVFEVNKRATKEDVARAIKDIYKVTPKKIAISSISRKKKLDRNNPRVPGYTNKGKKAYVYLEKSDKIQLT